MNKNGLLECTTYCSYCQSWMNTHKCSHPGAYIRYISNKPVRARECCYEKMDVWNPQWITHPCPFFKGRISIKGRDGVYLNFIIHQSGQKIDYPNGKPN